jgi:hypothetical protein
MIPQLLRWRAMLAVAAGLLVAVVIGAAVVLPRSASARGRAELRPFGNVALSPAMKRGIEDLAERAGIAADRLHEVVAVGPGTSHAGVLVGTDAVGRQLLAFVSPYSVGDFASGEQMVSAYGDLVPRISIQPAPDGHTGHVETTALVGPRIAKVTLDLANGTTTDVQLVRVGVAPYSVFAYASDDPKTFPQVIHAFGRDGREIVTRDVSRDIAPPLPQQP